MLVHVPVDEIEIVQGSLKYNELFFFMGLTRQDKSIEMDVILRTSASKQLFKRKLTLTSVPKISVGRRSDDHATIIGTFAGNRIEGIYHTKSRKGSFRLAD
jgi:hypothetical protein